MDSVSKVSDDGLEAADYVSEASETVSKNWRKRLQRIINVI